MSLLFTSGDQNTGAAVWTLFLPVTVQGWFPFVLTGLILLSNRLSLLQPDSLKTSVLWHSAFFVSCFVWKFHDLLNMCCTSALTIKENNTFRNQIRVTGSGIQNGAGWPLWMYFQTCFCIAENLNFLNSVRLKDTTSSLKIMSASSYKVQICGLKFFPCNHAAISDPNKSSFNQRLCFLPAPVVIVYNVCNSSVCVRISLSHFVVWWNSILVLLVPVYTGL